MKGNLVIDNRQRAARVNVVQVRRLAALLVGEVIGRERFELGICLLDGVEMARLNETFLRHAGSTDVITFDYGEGLRRPAAPAGSVAGCRAMDARPVLAGEILVCMDEAIAQARRFRTSWQEELARYIIHGVLHLEGFDDRSAADRREMKREEDRLLRLVGRRFAISGLGSGGKVRKPSPAARRRL